MGTPARPGVRVLVRAHTLLYSGSQQVRGLDVQALFQVVVFEGVARRAPLGLVQGRAKG